MVNIKFVTFVSIVIAGFAQVSLSANGPQSFTCDVPGANRSIRAVKESDPSGSVMTLSLKGPIVDAIVADLIGASAGVFEKVVSVSSTDTVYCAFKPAWLYFRCSIHRDALIWAETASGEITYIPHGSKDFGTDVLSGDILDYADGISNQIRLMLVDRDGNERHYGDDYAGAECRYEN